MDSSVNGNISLQGTCGVGLFYNFDSAYGSRVDSWRSPEKITGRGGANWQLAGFIEGHATKEVYEAFKKRFKIVLQTPVRRNRNSGNRFFCVMYDTHKPRKSKQNPEGVFDLSGNTLHKWPFKDVPQPTQWRF
jgi:hypothetical protein